MSAMGSEEQARRPPSEQAHQDAIDDDSFAARRQSVIPVIVDAPSPYPVPEAGIASESQSSAKATANTTQSRSPTENGLGSVVIISGGSGYNDLVGATSRATYVMPISDDGGSSSEIIRVLGGPSIGDIRSRLVRMIPTSTSYRGPTPPPKSNDALHALLSYRLPSVGRPREIKQEWRDILEGRHALWTGIESERKECIRGFLVYFESEILRRVHRNFDFRAGSIGNFFLAAAQKFFRSIQSAIFLFSATAMIPLHEAEGGGRVLPVINTNHTATIGAVLEDGRVIVGQCEISHPSSSSSGTSSSKAARQQNRHSAIALLTPDFQSGAQTPGSAFFDPVASPSSSRLTVGNVGDGLDPESDHDGDGDDDDDDDDESENDRQSKKEEVSQEPSRKKIKRNKNIVFSKSDHIHLAHDLHRAKENGVSPSKATSQKSSSLGSRIARLFYVNAYGNEVDPAPNPEYLSSLRTSQTLLYSCGSLWTSIVPCLALRGVAKAITTSPSLRYKVLLLNTSVDRETWGLDAIDFVRVIARSMEQCDRLDSFKLNQVITHVVYCPQGAITIDVDELEALGIRCIPVELPGERLLFDEKSVSRALQTIVETSSS